MASINIFYDLGVAPSQGVTRVYFSQYDNGLNSATLRLYGNNYPVRLSDGITARIIGLKPSGASYVYDCEVSEDRTAVIVTTTAQMTAEKGTSKAQIILSDQEGKVSGTCNFEIIVEADPVGGAVPSESEYPVFYEAIEAAAAATGAAARAETAAGSAETSAEEATGSATTATEAAAAAEAAQAAIEADRPEVVAITIPEGKLWSAITAAQAAASGSAALDLTGATYDPADAARIRAAYLAGKRVRFDLTMTVGTSRTIIASAENLHTVTGARNYYTFRTAFDFAALGAAPNIDGLKTLAILYTYDGSTTPATCSVSATVEAVQEDLELIFTAPISDPIVTQTAIPATVNHTEEEVLAAYAAGRKVNAKIHFTSETPVSFDLYPMYTATIQGIDSTERLYSGLLVIGTSRLDAYSISAGWGSHEPVVMIAGKIGEEVNA